METIHRKDGRLHIYVRQDKYKGELKSHNWGWKSVRKWQAKSIIFRNYQYRRGNTHSRKMV